MKPILTILLIFLTTISCAATKKSLKVESEECNRENIELKKALQEQEKVVTIDVTKPTRKDVLITKQEEKTKRVLSNNDVDIEKLKTELEEAKAKYESVIQKSRDKHTTRQAKLENRKEVKINPIRNVMKVLKGWVFWLGFLAGYLISKINIEKALLGLLRRWIPFI